MDMSRMRLPVGAALLGAPLVVTAVIVAGCQLPNSHQEEVEAGAGGSPTTGTGGSDDLVVTKDCCVKDGEDPFEGPDVFILSTQDDVKDLTCEDIGLPAGFIAHADPIIPPSTCPACECSAASCKLPEEIHSSSADCPGGGGVLTPFDAIPGWEGTCDSSSAIPADQLCDGSPCVRSLSISALQVEPCQSIQKGEPDIPEVTWGTTARECLLSELSESDCGTGRVCIPPVPPISTLCLWAKGIHECTEPEYPRRVVVYESPKDDRACTPCECGPQQGAECSALLSVFSDGACGDLLVTETLELGQPICTDLPEGTALGSKGAFFKIDEPGTCAPSGGELSGGLELAGALTLCCQPETALPV
jgi:hypothetical protein